MPFNTLLEELVADIDGADAAIFLEKDGEAVAWYANDGNDALLRLRAAYLGLVLQGSRALSAALKAGTVERLIVEYEGATFIVEELDLGYFLVVEMHVFANVGDALHRIQPAVATLRQEIDA